MTDVMVTTLVCWFGLTCQGEIPSGDLHTVSSDRDPVAAHVAILATLPDNINFKIWNCGCG